jgi:Uncharacterised nucleotidyltransferase
VPGTAADLPDKAALAARVDALVDRARDHEALLRHRLGAIGARRWRELGREVPEALRAEEQLAAACSLATPIVLDRIAAACDEPLLLLKGPEVARRHPDPVTRPYRDLDLLAERPRTVFDALLAAGAEVNKSEPTAHHELPLVLGDLPLVIEVHRTPKWPAGARPPATEALFAAAVPAPWAPDGILTLPPSAHAVLIAAHSWAHRPLRRLLDLVDVAILLRDGDRDEAGEVARAWGVERLWRTTVAATDSVLGTRSSPWTLRSWARDLPAVRERRPIEQRLEELLAPFAWLPPRTAVVRSAGAARRAAQDSRIVPRRRQ